MNGIHSRLGTPIGKISELEDVAIKMTQKKHKEEKSENKWTKYYWAVEQLKTA